MPVAVHASIARAVLPVGTQLSLVRVDVLLVSPQIGSIPGEILTIRTDFIFVSHEVPLVVREIATVGLVPRSLLLVLRKIPADSVLRGIRAERGCCSRRGCWVAASVRAWQHAHNRSNGNCDHGFLVVHGTSWMSPMRRRENFRVSGEGRPRPRTKRACYGLRVSACRSDGGARDSSTTYLCTRLKNSS